MQIHGARAALSIMLQCPDDPTAGFAMSVLEIFCLVHALLVTFKHFDI